MKLLIIGAESQYAIERFYFTGFSELTIKSNLSFFPAQNKFLDYYNSSVINKIIFRIGLSTIYRKINKELKEHVKSFKPDVILIFKGMEIFPETLKYLKKNGIKLVNYNPDNPFIFSGKGSGNANISNSIGLYDLHFTYNDSIKAEIEKKFKIKSHIIPFGFYLSDELFEKFQNISEINKVCFLGNPDNLRADFIITLANLGLEIDVYGNGWGRFINHNRIKTFNSVYNDEMWSTLRKYRVQLNYMRPHNLDSHNMRTFEIPAIGGIQVAPLTPDHTLYFDNMKNIFLYENTNECYEICNKLLGMQIEDSNLIRNSAREKCLSKNYSYIERARDMFNIMLGLV